MVQAAAVRCVRGCGLALAILAVDGAHALQHAPVERVLTIATYAHEAAPVVAEAAGPWAVEDALIVAVPLDADGREVAAELGGWYVEGRDVETPWRRWIEVITPDDPDAAALAAAGALGAERDVLYPPPSSLPIDPSDPDYLSGRQWHHATIGSPSAWEIADGYPSAVGVVDTGVDCRHVELETPCGAGDWPHFDAVTRREIAVATDTLGHGTHVAGTIAAEANARHGVGVAPGAAIVSARACTATGCRLSDLIAATAWLTGRVDVLSYSLGGPTYSQGFADAIHDAQSRLDILVVASVGNDGQRGSTSRRPMYPATYPGVLGVAAHDRALRIAEFSQKASVDLVAPGVAIWATWPGGGHRYLDGTSMAAPMVSGAAALLRSHRPDATWREVADWLTASATEIQSCGGPHRDPDPSRCGWGRLEVGEAIRALPPGGGEREPTERPTPPPGSIVEPTPTMDCGDDPVACAVATARAGTATAEAQTPTATATVTRTVTARPTSVMTGTTTSTATSQATDTATATRTATATPCGSSIACAEGTATARAEGTATAAAIATAVRATLGAPTDTATPTIPEALATIEARATRRAWARTHAIFPAVVLGTGARWTPVPPTETPEPTRVTAPRETAVWCGVRPGGTCTPTPEPTATRCPGLTCWQREP